MSNGDIPSLLVFYGVFQFILAPICGIMASMKSRSGFGWGLAEFLLGPIVLVIVAAMYTPKESR